MKKTIFLLLTLLFSTVISSPKQNKINNYVKDYLENKREIETIHSTVPLDLSFEFKKGLIEMCDTLNIEVKHILTVFHVETIGTFSPSKRSPIGAVGLIQFTSSTAKWLGTSTTKLSQMSHSEQLFYVAKYFDNIIKYYGPLNSLDNVFMAVHYPVAIKISKYGTVYKEGSKAYSANRFNDRNKDGKVSKHEICNFVRAIYNKYYV
ncbi:MAG: hypothetical protein GY775_16825 [Candidatus Scalindua sp.]|nr:hypothetical protein [Candidatus Scalindua sp.]